MSVFKIYKDKRGLYSVLFKINNRIEFFSISHKTKIDCYKTIKLIKYLTFFDKSIIKEKTDCGSYFFQLVNISSGKKIGESQSYLNEVVLEERILLFREMLSESFIDAELYSL